MKFHILTTSDTNAISESCTLSEQFCNWKYVSVISSLRDNHHSHNSRKDQNMIMLYFINKNIIKHQIKNIFI